MLQDSQILNNSKILSSQAKPDGPLSTRETKDNGDIFLFDLETGHKCEITTTPKINKKNIALKIIDPNKTPKSNNGGVIDVTILKTLNE